MSATVSASAPEGLDRLKSTASLQILGGVLEALEANVQIPKDPANSGTPGAIEYYSFGKRIFSDNAYFQATGITEAKAGIVPVEVRVPIARFPVGPLSLNIDGGVRFQAEVTGALRPTIWLDPIENSILNAALKGQATGAGFIQGYASLLILRGGVGGDVNLIDGQLDLNSNFYFNGTKPNATLSTLFRFLFGRFYAFADHFSIWGWKWKRFWDATLFSWKGKCVSHGALQCPE
jgi:hypothetical protein